MQKHDEEGANSPCTCSYLKEKLLSYSFLICFVMFYNECCLAFSGLKRWLSLRRTEPRKTRLQSDDVELDVLADDLCITPELRYRSLNLTLPSTRSRERLIFVSKRWVLIFLVST